MAQISALISGKNKAYDYQLSALARFILNAGVSGSAGLEVTSGNVSSGEAFILATRTNGQQVMVHYQNTANVAIDTSGTTKVWVGLDQSVIDDGSANAIDGTGIATIRTGASYPSGNYIPLASISSGVITDEREMISFQKVMRKGLGLNKVMVSIDGVESELSGTPGYVVGWDGAGNLVVMAPTISVPSLIEVTSTAQTDFYVVFDGTTNKKISLKNLRGGQALSSLTSSSTGASNNWTYGTAVYSNRGNVNYSIAVTTSGSSGGSNPVAKVQWSRDNVTWNDLDSVTCAFFNQSQSVTKAYGFIDGGIYLRTATLAYPSYSTATASVTITT